MKSSIIGRKLKQIEGYSAFIPCPFPPSKGFQISPTLQRKHENATHLIGKLDGICKLLPDRDFFILMFIRKDAADSSQIEGTQASLYDAIQSEIIHDDKTSPPDVDDIIHYISAVRYAMERVEKLPLSWRLLKEVHKKLMFKARSTHHAYPGEFRKTQNWIGAPTLEKATYVPPSVNEMKNALSDLEKFMHADDNLTKLYKAGLIHAQFETIHPFLDGNGRTGRMLISLYLRHVKLLEEPILYLSSYFNANRKHYYNALTQYHDDENGVDKWLDFFLDAVISTAESSINTCTKIIELRQKNIEAISLLAKRESDSTATIIKNLYAQPIITSTQIMKWTNYTRAGAIRAIERLIKMGILEEFNDSSYGKTYIFREYIELFGKE